MRANRARCRATTGWRVPAGYRSRAFVVVGLATAAGLLFSGACGAGAGATSSSGHGGFSLIGQGGAGASEACALYELAAEARPVNLFILFDRSSSMFGSKWESAKAGLGAFVDDPENAGISAALRFFPRAPDATPACDQQAYMVPSVALGPLPANGAAIKLALDAESPDGFGTPMYPALGGALLMALETAQAKPKQAAAVLLVTDGVPQGPAETCGGVDPESPDAVAGLAAAAAASSPKVYTYVVGLPGVDQSTANVIAKAGGTDAAILVASGDVAGSFHEALGKVRGDVLPCEYDLPKQVAEGEVGLGKVNVEITPGEGDAFVVPFDKACKGGGWRFDDAVDPTAIVLCPETCAALKADNEAAIEVVLGCETAVL